MATAESTTGTAPVVRIGNTPSEICERMEARIRERAYRIFQNRSPDAGDPVTDWLQAELQVLSPIELSVKEQKKKLVVEGSLKGFKPREIEVEVSRDQLRVWGSHRSTAEPENAEGESCSELLEFYQVLPLPCAVDIDSGSAKLLKNGKLQITLPKQSPDK